jgi:hypothetical protein
VYLRLQGGVYDESLIATLWLESEEPVKVLQEILGHSCARCRTLRSGGTRIRTGDTMIFSPAKGYSRTLMGVYKPLS